MNTFNKNKFLLVCTILTACGILLAQNVANYIEQGGARTVIGGSLDVVSGGDLDIESGAALKIAGTQVTASAAEINAADITTAGAAQASKAVVLNSSKNIDGIMKTVAIHYGTTPLTVALSGTVQTNEGATAGSTFVLPEASASIGAQYLIVATNAYSVYVDCDGADQIKPLTGAAGDKIHSATTGATVRLTAINASTWVAETSYIDSIGGTGWTDEN